MVKRTSQKYYRDEELLMQIGDNIKKARVEMGISLKTLSDQSSITYSHLNCIEQGNVNFRISNLYKLAEVLGIDPGELFIQG